MGYSEVKNWVQLGTEWGTVRYRMGYSEVQNGVQ